MQLLSSPVQQQPLFTNLSYHLHYYQNQPQPQFVQTQFQPFQQQPPPCFQPQTFQQPQPSSQPSQVPLSQSQPVNLDDEDDDERVQETQPSRRRQKKSKDSTKKKNTRWTEEEEATLAKAWIAISQDGDFANAQSGHSFWNRILDHFHALLGRQTSRTYDSVNAKWHDLRATCTKFNGVFDNLKNMHRSGSNDFNILSTALHQYKITNNGKPFGNQKAWEVCRNGPKWVIYPETAHSGSTTGSNKRPRMSESEIGANLDLNDEFDATEGEGPSDVHLRRPPGRDKARKGASSSGKSTNEDVLAEKIEKTLHFLEKKFDSTEEQRRRQLALTNLQIVNTVPQPNLDPENLRVFMKIQQEVLDQYRN
ncbi:hypothetical protein Lser_V15G45096 [Lactuca serriola]